MSTSRERIRRLVERAATTPERALVVYLTLGDPLSSHPEDLALVAARAGADAIELGVPTPGTSPRGAEIRESFERALAARPPDPWAGFRALRAAAPDTALLALVFPETIADLGDQALLDAAQASGADALVLVRPTVARVAQVEAAGVCAIPVIPAEAAAAEAAALEAEASQLTYRTLAPTTGAALDARAATETVARVRREARKPFLVGFGLRGAAELTMLAGDVAGFVIGSQLLRVIAAAAPGERAAAVTRSVAAWKAAAWAQPPPP